MVRKNWRDVVSEPLTAEQVAVKLYDAARSKAEGRGLEFSITFQDVLKRVMRGRCEVTDIVFDMRKKPRHGPDLPFRASLDRIDNMYGYVDGNIQVVVKMYNQCKYIWNDEDVVHMANELVRNGRYLGGRR